MTNFKRFLTLSLIAALAISAWAVPAYRGWRTVTQPDGTTVNIRQMGDEFFHYWENEEGQQVAKDEQGFWRVKETPSVQSEIAKQKQASRSYNRKAPDIQKAAGQINLAPRGLVILVNFSDVTFKSGNTQSAMSELMNAENYTYNSATGSVREFFKAQSNGQYVPDFDVVGPYTLAYNRAHYGANDSDGEDVLAGDMVVEACKAADADGVDFTLYNNDGDSYVDFVYIIYAGVGAADSDVEDAIWPHNWTLSGARYYGNCTYSQTDSKVDGLYVNNYACSGELEGSATYRCPIGTIAHEFGHVLGLPDYYVTSSSAANNKKNYTPGAWHIMDYGSYNNEGRTPPNYSPHDKLYFGWYSINTSSAQFLAKDAEKNCSLTTSYGSWYQITGTTSSASATSTSRVWYLEDRQKSGWDRYLPGHGMVVWEVQYNSSNWTGNTPNNSSVGYTLVTANSLSRPYKPCVYSTTTSSTSGTPFPGTSNVRSYTPADGCSLTEITESSGNITFKYNGGADKTRANYEFVTEHCTAPADGDVAINAALSVTITPNSGYTLDDASCWTVEMGGVTLTYGSGFTYNASTNTFSIASLTDDVVIMAEAKLIRTVTWSVQGNTSTTTFADGAALVVPSPQPSDCSGTDGKIFVGWTAHSTVDGSEPDDLFLVPGTKTVTADITYYAVYADYDVTSGGGAFDGDTEGSYKIYAEVSGTKYYATGTGSKINSTTNEAEATEYEFAKVTGGWSIKTGSTYITYSGSTNLGTSASSYTWTLSEGNHGTWRVASGTSGRAWIYRAGSTNKFGGYSTGNVNGTEYFDLEIEGGSSSVITYSDYSLTCTDTPPGPTYTVTYMACGVEFTTQTYSEGDLLVLPDPAPEDNAGKSFYGWTATEHHTGASAPADAFTTAGSKTVTADVTYYAIYY